MLINAHFSFTADKYIIHLATSVNEASGIGSFAHFLPPENKNAGKHDVTLQRRDFWEP